ncbi:hypothetical protein J5837_15045 [Pseudoxanthomonas helianthi]|uniref:Uncharacterized protein n=1 Tax=Pseudoxanthomonas helianthi TaxID=1453541 RepID=A0A941AVP7_9GAMM|nr:hypothetical protein [Pseudoxanthomonas helianthi]MBP3985726.1 hypothetical protein [Pseudoxanthomonas helianthi]
MAWAIIWNAIFLFILAGVWKKARRDGWENIRFMTSRIWLAKLLAALGSMMGAAFLILIGFGFVSGKLDELIICKRCDRPDIFFADSPLAFVLTAIGLVETAILLFALAYVGWNTLRLIRAGSAR